MVAYGVIQVAGFAINGGVHVILISDRLGFGFSPLEALAIGAFCLFFHSKFGPVSRRSIVGVMGTNGAGKTAIVSCLSQEKRSAGAFRLGDAVKRGFTGRSHHPGGERVFGGITEGSPAPPFA